MPGGGRRTTWRSAGFHLVMEVVDRVPKLGYRAAYLRQLMRGKLN
jgi:hypothetical protein